jgi:hypothetical protein
LLVVAQTGVDNPVAPILIGFFVILKRDGQKAKCSSELEQQTEMNKNAS